MKPDVLEAYLGRWVAVDAAGFVVADADGLDSLLILLERDRIAADAIQRVPEADAPLFVGLG